MEQISFIATLPPIQSAVSVSGSGDGARIKLDIPGTELLAALRLLALTGRIFRVTIEPID